MLALDQPLVVDILVPLVQHVLILVADGEIINHSGVALPENLNAISTYVESPVRKLHQIWLLDILKASYLASACRQYPSHWPCKYVPSTVGAVSPL